MDNFIGFMCGLLMCCLIFAVIWGAVVSKTFEDTKYGVNLCSNGETIGCNAYVKGSSNDFQISLYKEAYKAKTGKKLQ